MIRYLRYLFLVALAAVLLTVALGNRDLVTLKAMPDDLAAFAGFGLQIDLPLYAVIFASIAAGLLIGFFWEWLREHKHRSVAVSKSRQVTRLERELAVMRDAKAEHKDDILALLDQRKAS
ncbi:MAG: LapA family protein [Rhodobacteraceae bacterium]|nr:LapA family protein [Paracoccaceae bacterium]